MVRADDWQPVDSGSLEDALQGMYDAPRTHLSDDVQVPAELVGSFRNPETGMVATLEVYVRDRRVRVCRLEVTASEDDPRGLDRDRLRGVPIGDLARRALSRHAWVKHPERGWGHGTTRDGVSSHTAAAGKLKPPGRPISDDEQAEVARVYLEHEGSSPVQAVAAHFHLSTSGAAKRVFKARKAGLLPETTKGRATNRNQGEG